MRSLIARFALIAALGCLAFTVAAVAPSTNAQAQAQAAGWVGGGGGWFGLEAIIEWIKGHTGGTGTGAPTGWVDFTDDEPDDEAAEDEVVIEPATEFRPARFSICLIPICTLTPTVGLPGIFTPLSGWLEIPLDGGEITFPPEVEAVLTFEEKALIEWVNAGFNPEDYNVCAYWYWKTQQ